MTSAQVPACGTVRPGGRLVVCPTPIGNLRDITLRALDCLREAAVIACEDTRRTRVLLDRFDIGGTLVSFHEHNERQRAPGLLGRVREGAVVALVSDAGMPLVSDPGHVLMRSCLEAGLAVEVLPGPSAPITALVASGLPAERFWFVGFLPRKRAELERILMECADTLVAFESPRRLAATLALLAEQHPGRAVAVCRELTKVHEEVVRGSAEQLAARYAGQPVRGEVVLVVEGYRARACARAVAVDLAVQSVRELVAAGARPRQAAGVVASLTGVGANELYRALTADLPRVDG